MVTCSPPSTCLQALSLTNIFLQNDENYHLNIVYDICLIHVTGMVHRRKECNLLDTLTKRCIDVFQILLVNKVISLLINKCKAYIRESFGHEFTYTVFAGKSLSIEIALKCYLDSSSFTSLNSWIWVCSNMENTLDKALCAVSQPPPFFLVRLGTFNMLLQK